MTATGQDAHLVLGTRLDLSVYQLLVSSLKGSSQKILVQTTHHALSLTLNLRNSRRAEKESSSSLAHTQILARSMVVIDGVGYIRG